MRLKRAQTPCGRKVGDMTVGPSRFPQCQDLEVRESCARRYQRLTFGNCPPMLQGLGV